MNCGQIALVNYPFTDASGSKVRPVLVVSVDLFNQGDDIIVVPISSVPEPSDPHAVAIRSDSACFRDTKLRCSSSVKWTKPLTISRRVVRRRLGELAKRPLTEVLSKMQTLFGE